jgi:biotin synthase-related radical SAM superfamily protein
MNTTVVSCGESFLPSSPEHLQMSLAAAMTLGLKQGIFYRDARLYCLNLLLTYPDGCRANCSYCGLQKSRDGDFHEKSFIRVPWPTYDVKTIIEKTMEHKERLRRVCISMVTHPRAVEDTVLLTERFHSEVKLPISVLMTPTIMTEETLHELKRQGAEMVSVAIDLATPELFDLHRGTGVKGPHRFEHYMDFLRQATEIFGKNRTGCHLIVGMGETELQMVKMFQTVRDLGARTHLFSFYPESGSMLSGRPAAPVDQYRRMQMARYVIDRGIARMGVMTFSSEGRLISLGIEERKRDAVLDSGLPFMTSGCPGKGMAVACNRPFGDGPPSDIRSYPFPLEEEDRALVLEQMGPIG